MATIENTYEMSICTDCYMYANGVLEESEDCDASKIATIERSFEQFGQYLFETDHSEYCEPDSDNQCNCNEASFSWYACDTCNSSLGGDRHSVVILTLAKRDANGMTAEDRIQARNTLFYLHTGRYQ